MTLKKYIGVKIVEAEPAHKAGYQGYFVKYPDEYTSWSPKVVFEEAYRESDALPFGLAVEALKMGCKVSRKGWNGKGMWLELQVPDVYSKMTLPYIYLNYPSDAPNLPGAKVPWMASQTDVLADDWSIL